MSKKRKWRIFIAELLFVVLLLDTTQMVRNVSASEELPGDAEIIFETEQTPDTEGESAMTQTEEAGSQGQEFADTAIAESSEPLPSETEGAEGGAGMTQTEEAGSEGQESVIADFTDSLPAETDGILVSEENACAKEFYRDFYFRDCSASEDAVIAVIAGFLKSGHETLKEADFPENKDNAELFSDSGAETAESGTDVRKIPEVELKEEAPGLYVGSFPGDASAYDELIFAVKRASGVWETLSVHYNYKGEIIEEIDKKEHQSFSYDPDQKNCLYWYGDLSDTVWSDVKDADLMQPETAVEPESGTQVPLETAADSVTQSGTQASSEPASEKNGEAQPEVVAPEGLFETEEPSDGSLGGETLKFVNLYWETDDLGEVEAVFSGGTQSLQIVPMERGARGVYAAVIPAGDYSRVTFRKKGATQEWLARRQAAADALAGQSSMPETQVSEPGTEVSEPGTEASAPGTEGSTPDVTVSLEPPPSIGGAWNLYGMESKQPDTRSVGILPIENNTFYYDMGEYPSYWGSDPDYDPSASGGSAVYAAADTDRALAASAPDSPAAGEMVYFIDLQEVEQPASSTIDRINIAFLKNGHAEPPNLYASATAADGKAYTMYERRTGIYSAPFPDDVGNYAEIAFQMVHASNPEAADLVNHYNFRGLTPAHAQANPCGSFAYESGVMDAFFLNRYIASGIKVDSSYWGAHPSMADEALDTQVLYVDAKDYTNNGIVADISDVYLSWEGMTASSLPGGYTYVDGKGYRITDTLAQADVGYFQFPYKCKITENTVLTLKYKVKKKDGTPTQYGVHEFEYKFMYVPRGGKNCIQIDNIWDFTKEMWTVFSVGTITERTIYYHNIKTKYDEVWMRVATGPDETYAGKEVLQSAFGWADSDYQTKTKNGDIEDSYGSVWLKLSKENVQNDFAKEELYSYTLPGTFTHVQFRGKKKNNLLSYYYSNRTEIAQEFSYPCFYATQTGNADFQPPKSDVDQPGITGFWRSAYSADTAGDKSIDIPTDVFVNEENAYYATSTFYDYYSEYETSGRKINTCTDTQRYPYGSQGTIFNQAAEEYYKQTAGETNNFKAMYLHPEGNYWNQDVDSVNSWTGKGKGPILGIAANTLPGNGGVTIAGSQVEMPFFNEDFLRGNNSLKTAVGNVYKNVKFSFRKDMNSASRTYGYWIYNSAAAQDSVRLSYDVNEGYFLKRTNEPIYFRNAPAFFPFNSKSDFDNSLSYKEGNAAEMAKLNCMFGMKMKLDFKLNENAEIYNEAAQKTQPIVFEFQGDDDTWIYIDGILALDLGGIHDAVRGEINFKNGTYTIKRDLGADQEGNGTVVKEESLPQELLGKLADRTATHTLTMFYMERGLYTSNLKVVFNFPKDNTFTVEKKVDVDSTREQGQADIFADLLKNMGGFRFELKNLVTSGTTLPVEQSAGYLTLGKKKTFYESGGSGSLSIHPDAGSISGNTVTQTGVVQGSAPEKTNMLQVSAAASVDISDMKYIRMEMKNLGADDRSAANLYLALVDSGGRRIGGYANTLGYEDTTNSFATNDDSILRIDPLKMQGDPAFDKTKVETVLIGVRRVKPTDTAQYQLTSINFFDMYNQMQTGGFGVSDAQISDYGSYASGQLTLVNGAWFSKQNKTANGAYDTGISRQTDNGEFVLANGQRAVFTDKFRTGSYLSLTEKTDERIFSTQWTLKEDGQDIKGEYLLSTRDDVFTVKNPYDLIKHANEWPLKDISGRSINDGREELVASNWGGAASFVHPTEDTIVYRSYVNPDSTSNVTTNLGVTVKNTLKRGTLTIEKKLSEKMKDKSGSYEPGDYTFDIYYTNIAGMGLESQLTPIEGNNRYVMQTVTVHVNETGTGNTKVYNIPAGTKYHIIERPSNGTKLVDITPGQTHLHENVIVEGVVNDASGNKDYTNAYVEGTAYASDQTVTFTNEKEPFYMDIEKKWRDGLTEDERAKLGIMEVHIQLQRRQYKANQDAEHGWKIVTKDFFEHPIGNNGQEYIELTAAGGWKTKSKTPLPYKDKETNVAYEYRIVEINRDDSLKNYEVTYEESRNPDITEGADAYLHITYRAINTPVGLTIKKVWDDRMNIAGVRPNKIRVKLEASSSWSATVTETNDWKCYKELEDANHTCDDSCYFELSAQNSWKQAAAGLTVADANGNPYYYRIAQEETLVNNQWVLIEKDYNGYQPSYSEPVLPVRGNTAELSVKNTLSFGNITIEKKDASTNKELKGAEFKLERLIPQPDTTVLDKNLSIDTVFTPRTGISSETGAVYFENLPYGKYKITETKAPAGYIMLRAPVYVTVDQKAFESQAQQHQGDASYDPSKKTITVTIKNEKSLSVPTTGGRGIFMFTLAGLALTGSGLLLYRHRILRLRRIKALKKNKKERTGL